MKLFFFPFNDATNSQVFKEHDNTGLTTLIFFDLLDTNPYKTLMVKNPVVLGGNAREFKVWSGT